MASTGSDVQWRKLFNRYRAFRRARIVLSMLYVICCRLSPWAYGVTRLYSRGSGEFTNHSKASIWACARQVLNTFHAHQYTPNDLAVWVYEGHQTSSACSTMHQIRTVHARICTCCMICVIISALVKCLLVSAGWGVAFLVGLWMQMAHAQRALRRSFVRRMASVLRP